MTWVLLMVVLNGQPAIMAAEFDTETACRTAAQRLDDKIRPYVGIAWVCSEKRL